MTRGLHCVCGAELDALGSSARLEHINDCEDALVEYVSNQRDLYNGTPPDYIALPCDDSRRAKRWRAVEHMMQCDECADAVLYYVESLGL